MNPTSDPSKTAPHQNAYGTPQAVILDTMDKNPILLLIGY